VCHQSSAAGPAAGCLASGAPAGHSTNAKHFFKIELLAGQSAQVRHDSVPQPELSLRTTRFQTP
jgi:hypothetical protein